MADLRISQLPPLVAGDVEPSADQVAVADASASETKRLTVSALVTAGVPNVTDGSIPGVKLAVDSVTAAQIAPDAVGASELADLSVDGGAVQQGVISGSALSNPRNHILGKSIGTADIADDQIDSALLAPNAVQAEHVGDDQISGRAGLLTKNHIEANSIAAGDLADGAVGTTQLADNSITGDKLQANTVSGSVNAGGPVHIVSGTIGTVDLADASVTDAKLASGINGSKLQDSTVSNAKLSGGIEPAKLASTTGAAQFLAGPTSGGGAVTARQIVGDDLPTATTTDKGGVSVPMNQGLRLNGSSLEIANDIVGSAGTFGIVEVSDKGLVTAFKALSGTDLPIATASTVGGVSVPGPSLTVSGIGALTHQNSGVTAGTYPKVTVDERGHVTSGQNLQQSDIPNLDASQITTGSLLSSLIADRSITSAKLADYATAYIQEVEPSTTAGANFASQLWFQESTGQLRMWNGNSWFPIGFGRLSEENLRWCGLVNAATGLITALTQAGSTAGFLVGSAISAATNNLSGAYFVVETPGSLIGVTPSITYDAGDWVLCIDGAQGWTRIDTLNSGGGGGGAQRLDDLLDVVAPTPVDGNVLVFNGASAMWVNRTELDGGTY